MSAAEGVAVVTVIDDTADEKPNATLRCCLIDDECGVPGMRALTTLVERLSLSSVDPDFSDDGTQKETWRRSVRGAVPGALRLARADFLAVAGPREPRKAEAIPKED
jgi:hypothetical protein